MDRNERLVVVCGLINLLGDTGKTRLQKLVYILQELHSLPLGYSYRLHHYGPYSPDLEDDLSDLSWKGYVSVLPDRDGYGYHVKPGEMSLDDVGATPYRKIVTEVYEDFKGKDRQTLELLATVHFVANILGPNVDTEKLVLEVKSLKPQLACAVESTIDEMRSQGWLG